MVKNHSLSPEPVSDLPITYKCASSADCENSTTKSKSFYHQLAEKELLSSKQEYDVVIDSDHYSKEADIGLTALPNSDFSSMLSGHLTEMAKVRQQGHQNDSKYSHHQSNLPRGNILDQHPIQYNPDIIFDDCFDLEEFVLGQPGFSNPPNNFISTQQLTPLTGNIETNIHSDSGRSSSQSSNETDHNTNTNIDSLSVWLDQADTTTNPNDYNNLFRHLSNPDLEQTEFGLMNTLPDKDSMNNGDKNVSSTRQRDCSLSNDSGVEGCVFSDSGRNSLFNNQLQSTNLSVENSIHPSLRRNSDISSGVKRSYSKRVTCNAVDAPMENHFNMYLGNNNSNNNIIFNSQTFPDQTQLQFEVSQGQSHKKNISVRNTSRDEDSKSHQGAVVECIKEEISPQTNFSQTEITLDGKNSSKKTAYNEKWGVKVLKAWCLENTLSTDFELLDATDLNSLLCRFWAEVRKSNGDYYGRNSLFNLRAMINKHLKGKPFCISFDIVTDDRFRTSNERLEKQLKLLKGIGRTITHKQPISLCDLRKMYDSGVLGTTNPLALLRKVWFEVTLHFCHKGAEAQEKLKKSSFHIYHDHNQRRYVARTNQTLSDGEEIRMYETGGDLCPVKSYELYLKKLHSLQARLFQQPRRKSTPDSPMWYGKAPIGEKALQQMMANISTSARLSKRYTNHCVRTTALEQFSNSRRKNLSANTVEKPHSSADCSNDSHMNAGYSGHANTQQLYSGNYSHMTSSQLLPAQLDINYQAGQHVDQNSFYYQNGRCGEYRTISHQSDDMTAYSNQAGLNYSENGPTYSPPDYNDPHYQSGMSPPAKRVRVDTTQNELSFTNETTMHEYNKNYLLTAKDQQSFHSIENKEMHRFFGSVRPFNCTNFHKTYSDDSGTGRSLLSPVSTNNLAQEAGHGQQYSMPQDIHLLSETVLAGSTYDLIGTDTQNIKSTKSTSVISEISGTNDETSVFANSKTASLKSRFQPTESNSFNSLPPALSAL